MTHAASFASGGMVTRITSSSAVGGVLSGLPRYFLMRSPSLLSSLAQSSADDGARLARFGIDAVVRHLALGQRVDDRPVGFLGKSLKRDGAQIAL
jgi:hypothetical protein